MAKSDYSAETLDKNVIAITDLNQGRMSVTNDIENVVAEVSQQLGIKATDYKWIYQDSDGNWDGWDPKTQDFIFLLSDTKEEAIEAILNQ